MRIGSETMKTENREYLGIAKVKFNAQGETTVKVFRDHDEKCICLERVADTPATLDCIPPYDEAEEEALWDKINAYKASKQGYTPRVYTRVIRPSTRKPTSRFVTRARKPLNLPQIQPRSYKDRQVSKKPLTVAEVSAIVAEELGSLLGGDE